MKQPVYSICILFCWITPILAATVAASGQRTDPALTDLDPEVKARPVPKATDTRPIRGADRAAKERYAERGAQLALQIDEAAATSRENAALLYFQALVARREPDPCTATTFNAVLRGAEPDGWIRVYLGYSLNAIEMAQVASQMPQCHWGPMTAGQQQLDLNLGLPLRRLGYLLNVDARTLAADGHYRAALTRCLTLRRLAHHAGDDTYTLFVISQGINTMVPRAIERVLNTRPLDAATLTWLKGQLAATAGTPFQPAQALGKWRDAELQFWRTRPPGRAFTREMVLEKLRDEDDRKEAATLTDEQLLVLALQSERMAPGRFGLSAPPELLERARRACGEYLQSALQIMNADLSYRQKHTQLQGMVASLDLRANLGDPISLLSEAPKDVEVYHRLMLRSTAYDNLLAAGIEICLVQARTGGLPPALPAGLPKDPYTGRDFAYERTDKGFILSFDPDNLSRIQVRQFEFRTQDGGPRSL